MNKGTSEKNRKPLWITLGAAAACLGIAGGIIAMSMNSISVTAGAEAVYPKMAHYPDESALTFEQDYDSWWSDRRAQLDQPEGYADSLWDFYGDSTREFLSAGENSAYSPVNLYMALAMLADTCDGESRDQILDLLGADSIESLRTQAGQVWNANYCDDGALTSVLANSIWLSEDSAFNGGTLSGLARNYYASSFTGKFGTDKINSAIRDWLNKQTGGFLKDAVENVAPDASTVFALYSTVYFKARWDSEFSKSRNTTEIFHAPGGDTEREFMHSTLTYGPYYYGADFSAVYLNFKTGCGMWLILPDEDKDIGAVLDSGEYLQMIKAPGEFTGSGRVQVELAVPKFDVSSTFDLKDGLESMGVTDIFSFERADFSPICSENLAVGRANHSVRVQIDEEGCTAASFVEIAACGAAMPPEEIVNMTFDRPFMFVIAGMDGQPLFTGTVCDP